MAMDKRWKNFVTRFQPRLKLKDSYGQKISPQIMLKNLWSSPEFHLEKIEFLDNTKKDSRARFYLKSVALFRKKKCEALKTVNKAIMCAESPAKLYMCYEIRSKILFELDHYKKSLDDLDRATVLCPSERKKKKLRSLKEERLRLIEDSQEDLESNLESCSLADSERGSEGKLPPCCKELRESLDQPQQAARSKPKSKYKNLFSMEKIKIPELKSCNPRVNSLTSSAEIGFDRLEKGRLIYAKKEIQPGEVISVEKAYSYAPIDINSLSNCSHCGIHTWTPLPCPNCLNVVFCSDKCRNSALASYHKIECPIVGPLLLEDPGGCLAIVRALVKTPFPEVKKLYHAYKKETTSKPKAQRGKDNDGNYSSTDLKALFHLNSNYSKLGTFELIGKCYMSLMLMELISTHTSYLGRQKELDCKAELDKECAVLAEILFALCLILPNGFCLGRTIYDSKFSKPRIVENSFTLGTLIPLFNHSCNPNAFLCEYGATIVVRALEPIKSDTEITINYSSRCFSPLIPISIRRTFLEKSHHFVCKCEVCKNDWVLLPDGCWDIFSLWCPYGCRRILDNLAGCGGCGRFFFEVPPSIDKDSKPVHAWKLRSMMYFAAMKSNVLNSGEIKTDEELKAMTEIYKEICRLIQKPAMIHEKAKLVFITSYSHRSFHIHVG